MLLFLIFLLPSVILLSTVYPSVGEFYLNLIALLGFLTALFLIVVPTVFTICLFSCRYLLDGR
ncbi:E3 ORFB [Tree shrew adenovirus 1]|uniref:E3 ORFB n=1 Tax=Tree shrew adenovirus serotype 1 TaxID=47680 RepID=A0A2U9AGA1_ADET1|nr:E3 ORFB [Tree shrew adenovirus 1]